MTPAFVIEKKRDGGALSSDDIHSFIKGYAAGDIPDYQMSALAMAIFLRGMTADETAALTDAMLHSGDVMSWQPDGRPVVDKHSTGGVGDKVSLLLAPLFACCQLRNPMVSGRGLGATGGTLDKLESIHGFRTDLSSEELLALTEQVGCVITGATQRIAPADKKLYALRDVTATVPSIPLITASIMSKKLAEGLDALVLDVKFGTGAFMKTADSSRALAESLVATGARMGVQTTALITDMNQPLGRMVGNALEVNEAVDALRGKGPTDLMEVTLALGAALLVLVNRASTIEEGKAILEGHIASGRAMDKLSEMVEAQGGDLAHPRPIADAHEVVATQAGFLTQVDTEAIGRVVIELGGGRRVMTDAIDHSVGIEILARIGDVVTLGQPLARIFASNGGFEETKEYLLSSFTISEEMIAPMPLVLNRIASS